MRFVVMLNQEMAKKLTEVLHSRVKDIHAFKEGVVTVQINPGYGMCCKCRKLVGDTKKARSNLMDMSDKTVLPTGIHIQQGEPVQLMDFFKLPMMWLCLECAKEIMGDLLKGV
ncbi:MAG: hypothetical protein RMK89_11710 [Armatimonadota bacterium]|nr:hypothetical protein [Armatimonadota bacterium]MDW8144114.1 hypothetical protein [Armatimonadota bacterium]